MARGLANFLLGLALMALGFFSILGGAILFGHHPALLNLFVILVLLAFLAWKVYSVHRGEKALLSGGSES